MNIRKATRIFLMTGVMALLCSCGSEVPTEMENRSDSTPTASIPAPTMLGVNHSGWKTQNCELCHDLPEENHTTSTVWDCAECHGGNGACDPNGANVPMEHSETDDCIECHPTMHGFDQPAACVSCHFADSGAVECSTDAATTSGAGLAPASELQSNCLNWPEQDISRSNHTSLMTSLAEGEPAVDFTLQDVDGRAYTLSDLLKTKLVLLVLGGFT